MFISNCSCCISRRNLWNGRAPSSSASCRRWSTRFLPLPGKSHTQKHRAWTNPFDCLEKSTMILNLSAACFLSQSVWILSGPPAAEEEPRNVQRALHRVHLPLQFLQQTQVLQQVPSKWEVGNCHALRICLHFFLIMFKDNTLNRLINWNSTVSILLYIRIICKVYSIVFLFIGFIFFKTCPEKRFCFPWKELITVTSVFGSTASC